MVVKQSISGAQTTMVIMPAEGFDAIELENTRELSVGKSVGYFTISKTYIVMKELFSANKIDTANMVFVDAISRVFMPIGPSQTAGAYFVRSPGALPELSVAVSRFLRNSFDLIIFESLDGVFVYQEPASVAKFVSDIASQVKKSKTRVVFYATDSEKCHDALPRIAKCVDKVIDLRKKEGEAKK